MVEALLEFVDMDGDGVITREELFIVYDTFIKLTQEVQTTHKAPTDSDTRSGEEREQDYLKCEEKFYQSVCKLFDTDGDGTIGMLDIDRIFDRVVNVTKAIFLFVLDTMKQVIAGSLPDLWRIFLKVKIDLLGGTVSITSHEIVQQIVRINEKAKNDKAKKLA